LFCYCTAAIVLLLYSCNCFVTVQLQLFCYCTAVIEEQFSF